MAPQKIPLHLQALKYKDRRDVAVALVVGSKGAALRIATKLIVHQVCAWADGFVWVMMQWGVTDKALTYNV